MRMSEKPSYLGLLNAIAVGESQAHCYLTAWIEKTDDPDVKATLSRVAAREGEHGMSFAKRINELGYSVRTKDDDEGFQKRLAIASSDRTDLEKMEKLGLGRLDSGDKPDIFDKVFTDHSIDIRTGELLGRYIAEERDSGRILKSCYEALKARGGKSAASVTADDSRLSALESKLDAVCAAIGDMQTMLAGSAKRTNGARAKTKA
ncbi:MAG: manganese catalase family protein [Actinobacteria bacterium]|nr:manganese catalase family protein [Actinomycetota bacterium]MBV8957888.1 manganese catalase family protein [Actinomycetota bacterium]